ncbi:Bug family tripartite tricarboxylate transporter substrate binding protein [Roseomonas sp. BN140053]|uniref:Bug family tripartite tricarboxylate transporter substrate binding protein n=1 Tax=Roseomonas sp. BN140053 TaxID=3391898 RepID=UPI0039EA8EC1
MSQDTTGAAAPEPVFRAGAATAPDAPHTGTPGGLTRRGAVAALLAAPALVRQAAAQGSGGGRAAWPADRPVRVIVPLAAGGTSDFLARSIGARLQEVTGQNFVVENRTGGGGAVGWQAAARAPADGTTVTVCDNALPLAVALNRDLGFDPKTELEPVTMLAEYAPILMVNPSLPVRDLKEFVAYAKERPGQLFYGSNGVGGVPHMQTELLQDVAGIRMNHVSYRGMAQAATDLVAGQVHLVIAVIPTILGQMRGGTLRAIAVGTDGARVAAAPDVPSAREQGIDFTSTSWFGMMAPRGTPPEMAGRMRSAVAAALDNADLRRRLDESGGVPVGGTPEALRQSIDSEITLWTRLVREKNIKLE